jgi:TonB family protein
MKLRILLSVVLGLFIVGSIGIAKDDILVRIWLFHGVPMDVEGASGKIEILSSLTHPQLTAFRSMADGPQNALTAALVDALLDIGDLKQLDELFLFRRALGKDQPIITGAAIKDQLAFRIDLDQVKFAPPQFVYRTAVWRSKEGAIREEKTDKRSARESYLATRDESRMVKIVDRELTLEIGSPLVVVTPREDGVYFMAVLLTSAVQAPKVRPSIITEQSKAAVLVEPPHPVQKILPAYPRELRKSGVKGEIGIRVTTDQKGNVENVTVLRPLHPYLDYLTVQAFLKWTYDPVFSSGKPVRAAFDYAVRFDPSLYNEEALLVEGGSLPPDQAGQTELRRIVGGCVEYSRILAERGLFFTCEESIREVLYRLKDDLSAWDLLSYEHIDQGQLSENVSFIIGTPVQIMDPSRTEVNRYVCDYQLTRKNGEVEERRIVLKQNGQKPTDWATLLVEKRLSAVNPIFHLLKIFDRDRQGLFSYELIGDDKIRGKEVHVIAAAPRVGNEGDVRSARIWAEKKSFQILKIEIWGVPLEGYEDVLRDSVALNFMPFFLTTHEFRTEKNGTLFPESTTVLVGYPSPGRPILKYKADLAYKKYKFFTVETSHEIKKR